MRKKSNFLVTLCCIFLLQLSYTTNAQMKYQFGQNQATFGPQLGGNYANFHLIYNKPYSNTYPGPTVLPDIRIEANINNVSHKWDIEASSTLSFEYGTGSSTAQAMQLTSNRLSVTGKTFFLGNRIELGEQTTNSYYMALGGKKLGNGWHFSGTNGGTVIQSDNQGNLSFITHSGSSVLNPSNIAANTPLKISSGAVVVRNRSFEVVDQNTNQQFNVGTNGFVTARRLEIVNNNGDKEFQIRDDGFLIARQLDVHTDFIPDYVFAEDYDLMSLNELETYLKKHKHLPKIKSEKEYKEIGSVNIGELQLQLLEKVEELTLYTIQQQKEIEQLTKEVKRLQKEKK